MKTTVLFFFLLIGAFFTGTVANAQCTVTAGTNTITAPSPASGCNPFDPASINGPAAVPVEPTCTLSGYQWQKNPNGTGWVDISPGGNGQNYDPPALNVNTDFKRGVIFLDGATPLPAIYSNVVSITVNPTNAVSVSISANPPGTVCQGTTVVYTAVPTNGGSTPAYQWSVNGINVGNNSPTYSDIPNNGEVVKCILTSNIACPTGNPASSNNIIMSVQATATPTITILANPGNVICQGTSVTFTSVITNGGSPPAYQWKVNGSPVGTNVPAYTYNPANNDVVTCQLTSGLTCASPNPVQSTPITMTVNPNYAVTASISANPSGQICQGASVTYTAAAVNGGSAPSYQWKVNGLNQGSNSPTFTYAPNNNEVILCVVTSNLTCTSGNPATSNALTMTVNPILPVSVTIAANPAGSQCQGIPVTYTATPVNGGASPTYQWQVNGINVGTSPTYAYTPANLDQVKCIMTSNYPCPTGGILVATSNIITQAVTGNVVVSVSIAANPSGAVCAGTSVTYTASPGNPGTSPVYQWSVNSVNVGINAPLYTYIPNNGDVVKCVMTSNSTCITGSPTATSNIINMTVNPSQTVSISISANPPGAVCTGTSVTYNAAPTAGGTSPFYQWSVNGVNAGSNSQTFSYVPLNNDVVKCVLTSSITSCLSGNPATSNTISMVVLSNAIVGVVITTDKGTSVCVGTTVKYTATAVNGGNNPSYQWSVNGINVGTNSNTYTYTPNNFDQVKCVMTSNATCISGGPTATDEITMTVSDNLPVSVTVSTPANPSCINQQVTFTATPNNGGSTPVYQWKVNGTNVGTNLPTYSYTPSNNDNVTCKMTSNLGCADPTTNPATSPPVVMQVVSFLPVSISITATEETICKGTDVIFTATPGNQGGTPHYQWKINNTVVATDTTKYQSSTLSNADQVICILTSSFICATGNPATSNAINMTVKDRVPVSVDIAADPQGVICQGTQVTFTATPENGGSAPTYQWKVNGTGVPGITTPTYSPTSLNNGDKIVSMLTSNADCALGNPATSNVISMTVDQPSMAGSLQLSDSIYCLNSKDTIVLVNYQGAITWQRKNGAVWTTLPGFTGNRLPLLNSTVGSFLYRTVVQSGTVCPPAFTDSVMVRVVSTSLQTLVEKAPAVHQQRGDLFLLCTDCGNDKDTLNYTYEWGTNNGVSDTYMEAFKNKSFCLFPTREISPIQYFLDVTQNAVKSKCNRTTYALTTDDLKSAVSSVYAFPNPNSGIFDLVLSSGYTGHVDIHVKNLLGKPCKSMTVEKSLPNQRVGIQIDFVEKGAYIIEVIFGNGERMNTKILVY